MGGFSSRKSQFGKRRSGDLDFLLLGAPLKRIRRNSFKQIKSWLPFGIVSNCEKACLVNMDVRDGNTLRQISQPTPWAFATCVAPSHVRACAALHHQRGLISSAGRSNYQTPLSMPRHTDDLKPHVLARTLNDVANLTTSFKYSLPEQVSELAASNLHHAPTLGAQAAHHLLFQGSSRLDWCRIQLGCPRCNRRRKNALLWVYR